MPTLSPLTVLLLAGAIQGMVLAVLLLGRRGGQGRSNQILAAIMFCMASSVLAHTLSEALAPSDTRHYTLIGMLSVCSFQLMWLYARSLARPGVARARDLLHFLVPVGLGLTALPAWPNGGEHLSTGFLLIMNLAVLAYLVWTMVICLVQAQRLKQRYSRIGQRSLRWLLVLVLVQLSLWLLMALAWMLFPGSDWDPIWALVCLVFFVMGFAGFRRPEFLDALDEDAEPPSGKRGPKYRNSGLGEDQAQQIRLRLEAVMAERKPYLDPDLRLSDLARALGVTPHQLSQVLNELLGQNFYDYVNAVRIAEARSALRDPARSHLTIAALALDLGFNSLSTFNLQFRRFSGTTPSRFRQQT